MKDGIPSRGEVRLLEKALTVCEHMAQYQREHPRTLDAGLHYISTDAATALKTLITIVSQR